MDGGSAKESGGKESAKEIREVGFACVATLAVCPIADEVSVDLKSHVASRVFPTSIFSGPLESGSRVDERACRSARGDGRRA